jgi:hypothetical protein
MRERAGRNDSSRSFVKRACIDAASACEATSFATTPQPTIFVQRCDVRTAAAAADDAACSSGSQQQCRGT